ncbi:FapA family protein [Desulfonatronum thioautotrophicum]|uniref:FapA family protein n=1 Tax=Desulfonatronum thioautotrophicum TaxID=617001 RepID=UPI000A02C2F9|nr:FapA family protein [Desulfonatronum thioautotrophicum]
MPLSTSNAAAMKHYLKHHFDPDFNHLNIKANARGNEQVDHLNRGYVHNVVEDQVLAELIPIDDNLPEGVNPRFILEEPVFPAGANTRIDPQNPSLLLAESNGYVYIDPDGRICVKSLLNIRRDVDYATGNISFIGDVVIHGSVRSGFKVKGRNILVKGPVEAATLEAAQSIQVEAGVKGDKRAELRAKASIKVKFCENALLSAGKNILVEGSCLHSRLIVGNALAIRDKLIGSEVLCRRMVRVGAQLGGGLSTITTLTLGYDPFLMQKISELESTITTLKTRREVLSNPKTREPGNRPEQDQLLRELDQQLAVLDKQRIAWAEQIATTDWAACAVIVPGEVRPGVELSIGQYYESVSDYLYNVRMILQKEQIAMVSPAEPKK